METAARTAWGRVTAILAVGVLLAATALANGGPFIVKYPGGDPAAKGVLARLGSDLRPDRETRLQVLREDLSIQFTPELWGRINREGNPPLVHVTASYRIRNPLQEEIQVDFGFPILRGIYINPLSMMIRPAVNVDVDGKSVKATILSNSVIYGIIRQQARETIERVVAADPALSEWFDTIRNSKDIKGETARTSLKAYLQGTKKWNHRDATLLVEYAGLDLGDRKIHPFDRGFVAFQEAEFYQIAMGHLGILAAIGEKKATQLLAHLAGLLDAEAASGYEKIFTSWGGDVRERSVDLLTGMVRPREISLESKAPGGTLLAAGLDPTIYARVDYLDPKANLRPPEKKSLESILKNLPVIFTFAPMNLLHYRVTFPPESEQTVNVSYSQFAYLDTQYPKSYQMAYVLHPASLWDTFGPIHLTVQAPEAAELVSSIPCRKTAGEEREFKKKIVPYATYTTVLEQKTGELFIALDAEGWNQAMKGKPNSKVAARQKR